MNKIIKVQASDWARFLRIRAASNALAKRAEVIKKTWNLPEAGSENLGTWVIVDGNGAAIGKANIASRNGYEVAAGYTLRLS